MYITIIIILLLNKCKLYMNKEKQMNQNYHLLRIKNIDILYAECWCNNSTSIEENIWQIES